MTEWKKTEHFKETEFGPMKTGETIEIRECQSCERLKAEVSKLAEELLRMIDTLGMPEPYYRPVREYLVSRMVKDE